MAWGPWILKGSVWPLARPDRSVLQSRLATSVHQPRHDHKEPHPTEIRAGCGCFLLSSGCGRGMYY